MLVIRLAGPLFRLDFFLVRIRVISVVRWATTKTIPGNRKRPRSTANSMAFVCTEQLNERNPFNSTGQQWKQLLLALTHCNYKQWRALYSKYPVVQLGIEQHN